MDWLSAIFGGLIGGVFAILAERLVRGKMLNRPPVLSFEVITKKGLTPSEVDWGVRIKSEPFQSNWRFIAKRRDIRQAKVQARFKYNNHVVSEFLYNDPDPVTRTTMLANGSSYDFLFVTKREGYPECYVAAGAFDDKLPAKSDISVLVTVKEGEHICGQSKFIIHNHDQHVDTFSVECVLTSDKEGSQN